MRTLAWLAALTASLSLAQTSAVGSDDLTRGVNLLPGSSAWSDEATSIVYNPAALGRVGRFNGWYLHEHSNARRMENDGVFLSGAVANMVGMGLSFQWLNSTAGVTTAPIGKTSLGFSIGPQELSLGVSFNWFRGGLLPPGPTYDLGVQTRPLRWLSVGALVRNVSSSATALTPNLREWTVGLGLRPMTERFSLGVDWVVREAQPLRQSRLQYTAAWNVVSGVRVLAGFSHAFDGVQPMYIHAGLGLDLENFGYTQGVSFQPSGPVNLQFAARFSWDTHDSLVPERKIAIISLASLDGDGGLTLGSLLGVAEEDKYLRLLRFLEKARGDRELEAVVLKVEGSGVGLSRADELRTAIVKLRQAGKKVFAYVMNATDVEYLMVSACDGIYAAPEAMFMVDGLRSEVTFFGGAAQKLGIGVDVARVGDYKNFPDQFTRSDMSDAQKEAMNAYLDTNARIIATRVQEGRGLAREQWEAGLDEGLKPVKRAAELKQIDAVLTPQQFDELLSAQLPNARVDRSYTPWPDRELRWGRQNTIAVIPVLGSISGGKDSSTPLLGQTAGAQSFMQALSKALSDPNVKAIVLRIDSPGGDGLASDMMYRAVLEAKKQKPVVASMGDVAASGGYYVAMGADVIVASPTTLTGSIGVFFVKPAIKKFAEDLGVTQQTLTRGKLTGVTSIYEPWTPELRGAAQKWVDDFYDTFITEAAASRKLSKEALDAVARGRVWSGEDAKAKGLVDLTGGLMDAIAIAKSRANLNDDYAVSISTTSTSMLGGVLGATVPDALLNVPVNQAPVPPALELLSRQLGPAAWLLDKPKVQARLEYSVQVR